MIVFLYLLIFIVSFILLVFSLDWLGKSLVKILKALKQEDSSYAFFIAALTASLPLFFIGISAAFHWVPQLSLGNIIGANIINLTLGPALAVFVFGVIINGKSKRTDNEFLKTAVSLILPFILMLDRTFSRIDGLLLIFSFLFYFKSIFLISPKQNKTQKTPFAQLIGEKRNDKSFLKELSLFLGLLVLFFLAAEGVVGAARFIAGERGLKLKMMTVGSLFLAAGTAFPALKFGFFGFKGIKASNDKTVLGRLISLVVLNSTLILGTIGFLAPLRIINFSPYALGFGLNVLIAFAFVLFLRSGRGILKREASLLFLVYAIFILAQFCLD